MRNEEIASRTSSSHVSNSIASKQNHAIKRWTLDNLNMLFGIGLHYATYAFVTSSFLHAYLSSPVVCFRQHFLFFGHLSCFEGEPLFHACASPVVEYCNEAAHPTPFFERIGNSHFSLPNPPVQLGFYVVAFRCTMLSSTGKK